jgi:putative lipoic acid-binding regulatory protein
MQSSNNSEEFYTKLKSQLYETSSWPTAYLFKFIVTSDQHKVDAIESVFDNLGAVINSTASKKGNYVSISIHVVMKDPEAVIEKYKLISRDVEGVISL